MKHFLDIALEDNFKGIDYTLINSNDPIISLSGGACTFNNNEIFIYKAANFLKHSSDMEKARTNNPTLIDECKQVIQAPIDNAIIIMHNELKKILTVDECQAVILHEIGHIHHNHVRKMQSGTAGSFIEMELEADQFAINEVGPEAMLSGLEKCLVFGAKFSIIALKESAPSTLKKFISIGVINRYIVGAIVKQTRQLHNQRFKTLERLKKERNK